MGTVTVQFNLAAENMLLQATLGAPCTGEVAKLVGKSRLEQRTGLPVQFKSYQAGPNKPEQQLSDDAKVFRGSILNFTVCIHHMPQTLAKHQKLHTITLAPLLVDLIARFANRLFKPAESAVGDKIHMQTYLQQHTTKADAISAALKATGSTWSAAEFANGIDESFGKRCGDTHLNTDQVLEKEFESLRSAGVVDLLKDEYPLECHILSHYEKFMQLLQ